MPTTWVTVRRGDGQPRTVTTKAYENVWQPRGYSLVPDASPAEDLDALPVAELRSRLEAAGLSTDGRKADLVERLSAVDTTDGVTAGEPTTEG